MSQTPPFGGRNFEQNQRGCIKIQFGTPSVFKLAENLILLKQ